MTDKEKKARRQEVEKNVTKLTLEKEEQIKDYFKDKCDLAMVQMKKSKDGNSGYAFIKFCNKEEERTIMRQHHQIDGRECRFD